ncbi:hypothetical protein [Saccharomonospora piscinae]|uniref:hypothetical protein n=1 Tax=Saccharomonospora piscinae TaxID=687388 RepID=UPI0012DF569A|nr:hypothetical protein [Saccharomonospora piscinae]
MQQAAVGAGEGEQMAATPLDAATDVLNRAYALLDLDTEPQPEAVRADVRRMALALGVAALDTHLHWIIRRVEFKALPKSLAGLTVPFGDLVDMAATSVAARKSGVQDRPNVRVRNALNEKLLTMTFQSARQVEQALNMAGVERCWTKLASAFHPPTTSSTIKQKLDDLSHRRNKIVHEGDLRRLARPRTVTHEPMDRRDVDMDLAWLNHFIAALDQVVR